MVNETQIEQHHEQRTQCNEYRTGGYHSKPPSYIWNGSVRHLHWCVDILGFIFPCISSTFELKMHRWARGLLSISRFTSVSSSSSHPSRCVLAKRIATRERIDAPSIVTDHTRSMSMLHSVCVCVCVVYGWFVSYLLSTLFVCRNLTKEKSNQAKMNISKQDDH